MNFYLDQLDDAKDKWWVVFFLSLFLFSQTMNNLLICYWFSLGENAIMTYFTPIFGGSSSSSFGGKNKRGVPFPWSYLHMVVLCQCTFVKLKGNKQRQRDDKGGRA